MLLGAGFGWCLVWGVVEGCLSCGVGRCLFCWVLSLFRLVLVWVWRVGLRV